MKKAVNYSAFILLCCIIFSCVQQQDKNCMSRTSVATDSAKPAQMQFSPEMEKLLKHFKDASLPLVADSLYITKVIKGDSLGASDVRLIAKNWYKDDSLQIQPQYALKDFYTIDSVKAKGVFAKWASKLGIGEMKYANVYALQKVKLDENTTLLIWSLCYSSYEADPVSNIMDLYYTILNKGEVGDSYLLGGLWQSADPPSEAWTLLAGKLNKDGNIAIEETNMVSDLDSLKAEITKTHYEYAILDGKIKFKAKKGISYTPNVPIKE